MKKIIYVLLLTIILNSNLPNDVQWVRSSNEYKMLCFQVYNHAMEKLKKYKFNNSYSLNIIRHNYAVVMDLDETVLELQKKSDGILDEIDTVGN